jgi:hypothetical protein
MTNTRNILLIGVTGSGKSTLANVITGTKEFRESDYSVSGTKKVQIEEFNTKGKEIEDLREQIKVLEKENKNSSNSNTTNQQHGRKMRELESQLEKIEKENIKYRIIDTVGVSDTTEGTKMSLNKIFYNLSKVGYIVKDGLNQMLIVMNGDPSLINQTNSLYSLLKKTVFDENIAQYTTIVRTNFSNFEDEYKCEKDGELLSENSGELGKAIDKIIHVDNPSIHLVKGTKIEERKKSNAETRETSRRILLEYLADCEDIYKSESLDNLNEMLNEE